MPPGTGVVGPAAGVCSAGPLPSFSGAQDGVGSLDDSQSDRLRAAGQPPNRFSKPPQSFRYLFTVFPLAVSAAAYWPILGNSLHSDDFFHLYNLVSNGPLRFLLTPHGGHVLIVRNLVFTACYLLFGLNPLGYFVLVLATHLANVYLLFLVIRQFTGDAFLACCGATVWGVLPLNEGALGWYSVYGHVLLLTIVLWLLYDVMRVRGGEAALSVARGGTWFLLLLAASTCFGIGAAVAMTFAVVAYLLLPRSPQRRRTTVTLASLVLVVPALYGAVYRVHPERTPISGPGFIVSAASNLPGPVAEMFGVLLTHAIDNLALPYCCESGVSRLQYGFALGAGALLLVGFVGSPADTRRRLAALTLLVCSSYASIAAGRGWLVAAFGESLMTAPRYHYLGPALMVIVVCLLLHQIGRLEVCRGWGGRVLASCWLAVVLAVNLRDHRPIDHHDSSRAEVQAVLRLVDSLSRKTPLGQELCIHNRSFQSLGWGNDLVLFPGWAAVFAIAHPDHIMNGRTVRFIESAPRTLAVEQARPHRYTPSLLVAPDRLPPNCRVF
jgi:hypothetical protein